MSAFQCFSFCYNTIKTKTVRRTLVLALGLLILLGLAAFLFPQQVLCVDSGDVQGDAMVVLGGGSYERPLRAAELFLAGAAPRIIVSGFGDGVESKRLLVSKGVPEAAIAVEGKSRSTRENALFSIRLVRAGGAKAETLKAEMLKSEGGRTEDGGRKAGKAETLKAEILKSKGGRQKTEDGRRRAEESGSGRKAETLKTEMLKSAGVRRVIIVTSWYHSRRALHTFQHYAPDMQFYSRPSYYGYPRAQWSRAGISGYIRSEYVKLAGYWVCYGVWPF